MPNRFAALLVALICNGALLGTAAAAPPADAPAGAMGVCNDGSYSTSAAKRGACRGHKGVKEWYGADAAAATPGGSKSTSTSTSTTAPASPAPATTTSTAAAPAPTPAPARTTATPKSSGAGAQPAAGGGPGQVWVNASTKVYHCTGDRWYGKSKQGSYMSEADAKAQGARASHGKACAAT